MDFGTSIKTCFKKFGIFEGRAGKAEFWYFYLLAIGLNVASFFIDIKYFGLQEGFGVGPATTVVDLVFGLPGIAVASRRLHDIGKSGWWQLISLTGIGLIPLIIWWASDGGKKYRPSTTRRDDDEPPARRSRERSESKFSFGSSRKSGKTDIIDELEEVKELYEDGTLSEAQFKKAKEKLLK